jgi:hypothetical protein
MDKTTYCTVCATKFTVGEAKHITDKGYAVHGECIEEHCSETNCFGCSIGKYSNCVFQDMKKAAMNGGKPHESKQLR